MEMFPNALVTGIKKKKKKAKKAKVLSQMGTLLQVIFLKILEYYALKMSIIWHFYSKEFYKIVLERVYCISGLLNILQGT